MWDTNEVALQALPLVVAQVRVERGEAPGVDEALAQRVARVLEVARVGELRCKRRGW